MTITTTVPSVPNYIGTPPSSADPANFDARADYHVLYESQLGAALNPYALAINQLSTEINAEAAAAAASAETALLARDIAVGAANYRGEYMAGTTYLTGQSVSYLGGRFIAKTTNLGITPVDGTNWLEIKANGIYRNFLMQSAPIVLTKDDAGGYILIDGTTDLTLTLPDATTLNGLREFTIKNTGLFTVTVNDFAGNFLFLLQPETGAIVWASSIATPAGVWAVYENIPDFLTNARQEINARQGVVQSNNHVAPISSTQAVKIYGQRENGGSGNNLLYAVVVTNTAGVLSYGTPTLLTSDASGSYYASVAMLTSSTGLIVYQNANNVSAAVAFTRSGTVITAGTPVTVDATSAVFQNINALSSTAAAFVANTGSAIRGAVLTVSGTTITVGTVNATLSTVNTQRYIGISALSATLFAILYAGTTNTEAKTVTVTGTGAGATLTANATATVATGVGNGGATAGYALSAYTSTALLAHYQTSAGAGAAVVLTVSGTTITTNTAVTVAAATAIYQSVSMLSSNNGVNVYRVDATGFSTARAFTISGTTITQGTAVTLQANGAADYQTVAGFQTPSVATPSATTALVGYNRSVAEYAQPISVTGSTITANASRLVYEYANTFSSSPYRIAALSATRSIYLSNEYADDGRSSVLFAYLMDVSGANQVRLAKVEVGNFGAYVSICPISSTQAIAFYQSGTGTAVANVITMSGNTLSVGAQATVNAATTVQAVSIGQLGTNSAVVHYYESDTLAAANVLTVSGTTITVGAKATVTTVITQFNQIAVLSGTQAIAFYSNQTNQRTDANLLTISGTSITVSATVTTNNPGGNIIFHSIIPLSSSRALAYDYRSSGTINYIYTIDVVGGTLVANAKSTITLTSVDSASIAAFSPTKAQIVLQSGQGSNLIPNPLYSLSISANGSVSLSGSQINIGGGAGAGTPYATLAALQAPAVAAPNANQIASFYRAYGTGQSGFYETRKFFIQSAGVQ